jgi:uncharacterized protein (DUF58 family)
MRHFLLLALLAYGLLLLGLAAVSREWLALALPLVLYLTASLALGPESPRLHIMRTLSAHRVAQDTPVTVRVSVTNQGAPLEELWVEDLLPEGLELRDGQNHALGAVPTGGVLELCYTVSGARGEYAWNELRATASDALGLFRRRRAISLHDRLLVLPGGFPLHRLSIRPQRTHGFAGPAPARLGGPGVEFYGVREYQPGDPLRWINWRASARHPRALFTSEFEQERIADVGLILDARKRSALHVGDQSLLEHAIRAAASLSESFLQDGNRVGLLIYGWFLDWTFPGYGKEQSERILRALARTRAGDSIVFETLDYLPVRFFPPRSQIVIVSPLFGDDVPTLIRLRARGYSVLLVSPDPIAFEISSIPASAEKVLAVRIARLERVLHIRALRRAGIQVVDWAVDKPLDQAMHSALGRLSHLHGVALQQEPLT